ASQLVLLAFALLFPPAVIELLAPGFRDDPTRFGLAVTLTRITFPYLLLMTVVTLFSGILNSLGKFATAAAAPILLNLTMVVTLLLAALFPTAGHAAAWGVLLAGILEVLLVGGAAVRADAIAVLRPDMARRSAANDAEGARLAQERAVEFTLLLATPCVAAFLVVPDLIMRALFMRGQFTAEDALAAAWTLSAYTLGLIPFVLM